MKITKATTVSLRTNRKARKVTLRRSILAASISALVGLAGLGTAGAATDNYTNLGGTNNWSQGLNWTSNPNPPNNGDALNFNDATAFIFSNNDTLTSVNSMTWGAAKGAAVTTSGNALTINTAAGITNNSAFLQTLTFGGTGLTLGTSQAWTANTAAFNITANVNLNGQTLTVAGASNTTLGGTVSGSGGLIKNGTGNLIVTNALTLDGGATLNAGTVTANGGLTVSGGTLSGSGTLAGSLNYTSTSSSTFAGVVSGAGSSLTLDSAGGAATLTLTGANTYGGPTNVFNGTLSLGAVNAIPVGTVLNIGNAAGTSAGIQVNLNGNNQSISALNFTEPSSFSSINLGGATLTLTGNVSVVSNTTAPGTGGHSQNINFFGGGGALDLGGATRTFNIAAQGTFGANGDLQIGAIIQNGGITLNQTAADAGGGPAVMEIFGANTYNGVTTVNSGVLRVESNTALGSTVGGTVVGSNAASTATLQLGGGTGGGTGAIVTGLNITGEALTINGKGAASGAGNLGALSNGTGGGNNTYAGAIIAATDATISANNGTLTLTGGISKNGVNLTLGGLTASNAFGTINVNSVISGAAANSDLIVDSVTTNLNAANTYNGQTFIRSTATAGTGILNANVAGALPDPNLGAPARSAVIMDDSGLGGSTLNIAGASQVVASLTGAASSIVKLGSNTLTIGTAAGTTTFAGVISGNGGIFKDGASTQILTGNNTYFGQTRVNGGTLQIGDGATAGSSIAASVPVIVDGGATLAVNLVTGGTFTNDVTNNGTVLSMAGTVGTGTSQTFTGKIDGSGQFVANAGGTTILANINGYQTGTTVSNNSTLQVGTTTAAATAGQNIATNVITLGGGGGNGTLDLVNVSGGILANNITGAGGFGVVSLVWDNGSSTTNTLTGQITDGAGRIQVAAVSATGTLILANANNAFTGGVGATSNGTLQIGTATTVGSVGTTANVVEIGNGGTVVLVNIGTAANNTLANNIDNFSGTGTFQVSSANTNTLSGVLSNSVGTLNLVQSGTGTTILTNTNTYSGTTVISGGTLQVGAGGTTGTLGNGGAVTNNAILTINRSDAITIANNISGTGVFNQVGTGVTTLSGNNSYTGATNVQAGTLQLGSNTALGSSSAVTVIGGATLDLNGTSPTFASPLNLNGTGVGGNGVLTNTNATASTYSGPVTLQSSSSIGSTAGDITLTNTVAGGVGVTLTKIGTNTLTLNAANTYNGATQINGGILVAGNNIALGDTAATPRRARRSQMALRSCWRTG